MDHEDEQLRALFTTVGEQQGPPLGFTADGIARRGRRIRVARWGAGVAASVVVATAITATIALTANRDVQPGNPAPVPEITTTDDGPTATPDLPTTTTTTPNPEDTTTTTEDTPPATT